MDIKTSNITRDGLKRLNVRISEEANDFLEKRSAQSGLSKTAITQIALESYMQTYRATNSLEELADLSDKLTQVLEQMQK